jgi:hypothetical protein
VRHPEKEKKALVLCFLLKRKRAGSFHSFYVQMLGFICSDSAVSAQLLQPYRRIESTNDLYSLITLR